MLRGNHSVGVLRGERGIVHLLRSARTQTVLLGDRPPQRSQCAVGGLLVWGSLLQLCSASLLLLLLRKKDQIFDGGLQTDRPLADRRHSRLRRSPVGFGVHPRTLPVAAVAYHCSVGRDGAALGCSPRVVPAEAALCSQCSRLHSNQCGSAASESVGDSLPLRAEWEQSDERHSLFGGILLYSTLGHVNHSLSYPIF